MELLLEILNSAAIATLVANVITMFVKDSTVDSGKPVLRAVLKLLNAVALNVLENKNAKDTESTS